VEPPFGPILVELGPISVHWYGFLISVGILMGTYAAQYMAEQAGKDPEHVWDMLIIVVVLAIVGARAYHVFSQPESGLLGWSYYKENPWAVFAIWNGGLGIYGAIVGGVVGVAIFSYLRNLRVLRWLDFLAPATALGQSIGRWGNYMNRELYGPPTDLPWGLRIPRQYRIRVYADMSRYPPDTLFHPTFLYESLATLALCLLLIWIARRFREQRLPGDLLFGYLMGYAVIRFFTEYLRPDAWMMAPILGMGPLAAAQVFAIILFGVAALTVLVRHLLHRPS
jgi:phosphatidylglycerol:prolipoprotein diacylglycerol transferase